jgi:hypothetical protein
MKRFSISLPDDLAAWLAVEALRERRSLGGQITYLLEGAWARAVGEGGVEGEVPPR